MKKDVAILSELLNQERFVDEAIQEIRKRNPQLKSFGYIDCPKCGKQLRYIIKPNGNIWGKCITENCLNWMM